MIRSFLTVSSGTLASRLLGYLRDSMIASLLGASAIADAFLVAFQFVNVVRRLLSEGALNAALVPAWMKLRETSGAVAAASFAGAVLGTISAALIVAAVLLGLVDAAGRHRAGAGICRPRHACSSPSTDARLMLPYLAFAGPATVLLALASAQGRFFVTAFSPLLFNLALIAVMIVLIVAREDAGFAALALAATVGIAGLLQLFVLVLRRGETIATPLRVSFDPEMRGFFARAIPGMIASAGPQLLAIAGAIIASSSPSAVSWLYFANRLIELPLGMVGVAMGTVLIPELTRALHGGDRDAIAHAESRALELAAGLALPAMLGLIVLSAPIVRLLFEHGAFTAADTASTAQALVWLALGLPAHVAVKALSPAFFAREDTWTPLLATLKGFVFAIALALLLGHFLGVARHRHRSRLRRLEHGVLADPAGREQLRPLARHRCATAAAAHRRGGARHGRPALACLRHRRKHPWPGAGRAPARADRRRHRDLRPAAAGAFASSPPMRSLTPSAEGDIATCTSRPCMANGRHIEQRERTMAFVERVFSGVQPTGNLHLGNYLGAIVNFVKLQETHNCIYCVVDMHAITHGVDVWGGPAELAHNTREVTAAFIAAGIDPKKHIVFNQSQVSGHAELAWIFNCVARVGWLNRMTQFKEKAGKDRENASVGLYDYPVLMAADILLYRATHVPVGDDQKQHLELSRDIAQKFNNDFGDFIRSHGINDGMFFPLPEPLITGPATRVMSLRDGTKKMSKSDASDYSRINLTDDADTIAQKIRKAKTDPEPLPTEEKGLEKRPEADNLVGIFAALAGRGKDDVLREFGGGQFSSFKNALVELCVTKLSPIAGEMRRLTADPGHIDAILIEGADRARAIAAETMQTTRDIVGFVRKR